MEEGSTASWGNLGGGERVKKETISFGLSKKRSLGGKGKTG